MPQENVADSFFPHLDGHAVGVFYYPDKETVIEIAKAVSHLSATLEVAKRTRELISDVKIPLSVSVRGAEILDWLGKTVNILEAEVARLKVLGGLADAPEITSSGEGGR
jgi:hypothetical protein